MRNNLLAGFTGETLGYALNAFEAGNIRQAVLYFQSICERDDVVANVKGKREKSTASRDWQIIESRRSRRLRKIQTQNGQVFDEEAVKAQADVLFEFWDSVTAVNAYDRNDRGAFSKLLRQMLTSVSFKYAAHHIVWKPVITGAERELRAEFEFVPLQFFENTTGTLRFCPQGYETVGQPLAEGEWMVTCGDGLMIAGSIDYLIKRNAIMDWMRYSEMMGIPGTVGHTKHAKGTPGGDAMEEAVKEFGNGYAAVIFEDDGEGKIELVQTSGGTSSLPFPALVQRSDQHLAALYRGADLSSMSSGSTGQGAGASLQAEETDILDKDDATMIEETLDAISRRVLQWHFGEDVKPLAYLKIIVPTSEQKLFIEIIEMLVKHGAKISVNDVMERLGVQPANEGDETLQPPLDYKSSYSNDFENGASDGTGLDALNERQHGGVQTNARKGDADFLSACTQLLAQARVEDQQGIARALKSCLAQPDEGVMPALLAFNAQLPDYIASDAAQVKAWESIICTATLRGWSLGAHQTN